MRRLFGNHGTYELVSQFAEGGNGIVWRAIGANGVVAIKILKPKARSDALPRFSREIETLQRLKGVRGVLPLLDFSPSSEEGKRNWYAMPLATPIRDKLGNDASLASICEAMANIAAALRNVHQLEISHRDIKPANLFWHDSQWCLGDFGLADFENAEQLTKSLQKLGPIYYIAPEMVHNANEPDCRPADVFSLGKTIWVLATGQNLPPPGPHDPSHYQFAIESYRNDRRSASLDQLVWRMTHSDPKRRLTVEEVARELSMLSTNESLDKPTDPTSAFGRLRALLVPDVMREENATNQRELAKKNAKMIRDGIDRLVALIEEQTQLQVRTASTQPAGWGFQSESNELRIDWDEWHGFEFWAGTDAVTWRLGIGSFCQLLSDERFAMHVGYFFNKFEEGAQPSHRSLPAAWAKGRLEKNGLPSCVLFGEQLVHELEANLPSALESFAELVENARRLKLAVQE